MSGHSEAIRFRPDHPTFFKLGSLDAVMMNGTSRPSILIACAGGGFAGEITAFMTGFDGSEEVILAYPRVEARNLQKRMRVKHFILTRSVSHSRRAGLKKSPRFWFPAVLRCMRQVRKVSPTAVVFLGSSEGLPLLIACFILRVPSIYIESITRVKDMSFTGKIIYYLRLTDVFLVQWPDMILRYPRAQYHGVVRDIRYDKVSR